MNQKAVAYIDLLGFSNCVKNNPEEAIMMLTHFNTILSSLNFEREVHPSANYIAPLQSLARRTSNESFEHFMPFSDSVFIASSNCSDFLLQLGNFVKDAFLFNARIYSYPENPADPTATHYIGVDPSNPKNVIDIPCHQPPVLFRGGLSFGDVIETTPAALFNNQRCNCNNLMGEAVVRAVKMEGLVKGPRILFDVRVYEQLNAEAKLYCRLVPDKDEKGQPLGLYEILWPAMGYITENKELFTQEIAHFYDLFTPAYNLWRFYKGNEDVAIQYERFLELIVTSAIRIYDYMGMGDYIRQRMVETLKDKFTEEEKLLIFEWVI
jgi:hypothetical protein